MDGVIAVRDRINFDYCPNLIKFYQILSNLPKSAQVFPSWLKFFLNWPKKFARGCGCISCVPSSNATGWSSRFFQLQLMLAYANIALADSSAGKFRTLPHRLQSSISSAVAGFASACKYLCLKMSCVDLYVRP